MPGKIIVGYDGSEAGAKALDHALMLAGKLDAALCLIHVIDWSPFEYHTLEENEVRAKERREEVETDRRELFPPAEEKAREAGIDCACHLHGGLDAWCASGRTVSPAPAPAAAKPQAPAS